MTSKKQTKTTTKKAPETTSKTGAGAPRKQATKNTPNGVASTKTPPKATGKVSEYKVVKGPLETVNTGYSNIATLSEQVNTAIEDGWEPQGGIESLELATPMFYQAMVRRT